MKQLFSLGALLAGLSAVPAMAQDNLRIDGLEVIGVPVDRETGFQPAVTRLAQDIHDLDWLILVIITLITVFVVGLMGWVILRYNAKRNPEPANFTHHTPVEVAWTVGPIIILVLIGAYSLPILFRQQEIPQADVTIKAIGNQWYWSYEYVDEGFGFDSYMIGSPATITSEEEDAGAIAHQYSDVMQAKLERSRLWPRGLAAGHRYRRRGACRQDHRGAGDSIGRDPRLGRSPPLGSSRTACQAVWPNCGSPPKRKASTLASVPSCAAKRTPICRSRSRWCRKKSMRPG